MVKQSLFLQQVYNIALDKDWENPEMWINCIIIICKCIII